MDLIIRNARLRGQKDTVDIAIEKDRISSVQPKAAGKGRAEIDAAGSLVLPGLFNLHLHADKSLLGEVMRPNISGTLPEAIEITNDFKRKYDPKEVAQRAGRVIETGVKNGDLLAVSGPAGALQLPLQITDMPDRVVWVPLNAVGRGVPADVGARPGDPVRISAATPAPATATEVEA